MRTLPPAAGEFLLPRRGSRDVLCNDLWSALGEVTAQAGIAAKLTPHQLRHTYATSLLRAGMSLPGPEGTPMKLLGHHTANMTLRYVEIIQKDLQREFLLARQKPRHLLSLPPAFDDSQPGAVNAATLVERLSGLMRLLELYRKHDAANDQTLYRLERRLIRIRAALQKLTSGGETGK